MAEVGKVVACDGVHRAQVLVRGWLSGINSLVSTRTMIGALVDQDRKGTGTGQRDDPPYRDSPRSARAGRSDSHRASRSCETAR